LIFFAKIEIYEDSCSACVAPGFGFFGFNALRFIVAVIVVLAVLAVLAVTSACDLNSVPDAAARSLEDREPPLKSERFATNKLHAILAWTL
jgi:hypothetical protein